MVAVVIFALLSRSPSAVRDFTASMRRITPGRLPWLAVAAGAELVSIAFFAGAQRALLTAGNIRIRFRTLLGLTVGATAITMIVPVGAVPASGWLAAQYHERDAPMSLALWTVLAGGFAATVSILCLLLVGAAIANVTNLALLLTVATILVVGSAAFVVVVHHLDVVVRWLEPRAPRLARSLGGTIEVTQWRVSRRTGVIVFACCTANWLADAVCLIAVFELIGLDVPWRAVLFAFAASQVAGSVVPLPGGLGGVEGGLVGALVATGTPTGHTLAAAVVYRVVAYWGMALAGGIVLLVMARGARARARQEADEHRARPVERTPDSPPHPARSALISAEFDREFRAPILQPRPPVTTGGSDDHGKSIQRSVWAHTYSGRITDRGL